ncbi:DNA repair protein [Leisingera sp. JC1]|uniref:DNA repair protein n=1 Tax=Leisingera sp. JC1 TaxID=1855282 RepID=UPI000803A551|nr:DNA repair protein [Leisingera sp. JC1]OBY25069.1 DNA repair protein [Leisingera sp. JC1]
MAGIQSILFTAQTVFMRLAFALICLAAAAMLSATTLAALGIWPWLSLQAGLGGEVMPQAGMATQIALTALAVMLAFFLPANGRIMALESSHRRFSMNMEDVLQAYQLAHAGDRAGVFTLASEFDAVKERLAFMRDHPDLQGLEPDVLEVAAQMSQVSQVSHELAETYSDAKVARARQFLKQRQEELETFKARLEDAQIIMHELRQWTRDVEIEESIAKSHLGRLRGELFELLPELSAQLQGQPDGSGPEGGSVVPIQPPRRAD